MLLCVPQALHNISSYTCRTVYRICAESAVKHQRTYKVNNALRDFVLHFYVFDRWGFATHGCVDGYSRMIVFLHCCTANTAEQVATTFIAACDKYGLPQRVRYAG